LYTVVTTVYKGFYDKADGTTETVICIK
jgi:hypothetical protein